MRAGATAGSSRQFMRSEAKSLTQLERRQRLLEVYQKLFHAALTDDVLDCCRDVLLMRLCNYLIKKKLAKQIDQCHVKLKERAMAFTKTCPQRCVTESSVCGYYGECLISEFVKKEVADEC